MKNARQAEILNIVQSTEVETQEQLLSGQKALQPLRQQYPATSRSCAW